MFATVELELGKYERIRGNPARFIVAVGHLWSPEAERLVEDHERYWVVEKRGDAAEAADAINLRS